MSIWIIMTMLAVKPVNQSHLIKVEQVGDTNELACTDLSLCYDSSDVTALTVSKLISILSAQSTLIR